MAAWRRTLIDCYVKANALSVGPYPLPGGGTGESYIDGRLVSTRPACLRAIAMGMCHIIRLRRLMPSGCTLVAPVVSGVPIVVALALEVDEAFVMDRGDAKGHGMRKRFEGAFGRSQHCLVIDDLVATGATALKTISGLRDEGKLVCDIVVTVDRQEGGEEALAAANVRLHALVTKAELFAALCEPGSRG